jgi:hypothetical protein
MPEHPTADKKLVLYFLLRVISVKKRQLKMSPELLTRMPSMGF